MEKQNQSNNFKNFFLIRLVSTLLNKAKKKNRKGPSMNETQLKNKVMAYLNTHPGIYARKVSDRYSAGYPDIWGCYHGRFFCIESKSINGKVSDIQKYEMNKICEALGDARVCRSLQEVKDFIEMIREIHNK